MTRKLVSSLAVGSIFSAAIAFLLPLQSLAQVFNIGDRIEADPTLIGNWKSGVVIKENLKGWSYQVQLDGEKDPTHCKADRIRKISATSAPRSPEAVPDFVRNNPDVFPNATKHVFKIGDRVEADPTLLGNYKPGVITEISLAGWSYKVHLDGESDPTSCKADHIRLSNAPRAIPVTARPVNSTPAPAANTRTPMPVASTSRQQNASNRNEGDNALKPPGKGAPPSGVYNCEKISGSMFMGLGKIEIRGNTYRGIDEAGRGTFHPFTVDSSGGISWSHGLTGLPDGWTLRSSYYAGPDHMGRPLIKIYYRSKSAWNDLIDCVRER